MEKYFIKNKFKIQIKKTLCISAKCFFISHHLRPAGASSNTNNYVSAVASHR